MRYEITRYEGLDGIRRYVFWELDRRGDRITSSRLEWTQRKSCLDYLEMRLLNDAEK